MIESAPLTPDQFDDLGSLFCANASAGHCWCMWFLIPVRTFHANGSAGNRAAFTELAVADPLPMGLLARRNGEAVGWCATTRAARAWRKRCDGRRPAGW